MPRYNFNTVRTEYNMRNSVFKRRNIRNKERSRMALIKPKPKRLTSLNESPMKESNFMMFNNPVVSFP